MNKFIPLVLAASAAVGAAAPAMAQIGVSVGINQPGVYGRINIGVPAPALVLPDPVIVVPAAGRGAAFADLPVRVAVRATELAPLLRSLQRLWPTGLLRPRGLGPRALRA